MSACRMRYESPLNGGRLEGIFTRQNVSLLSSFVGFVEAEFPGDAVQCTGEPLPQRDRVVPDLLRDLGPLQPLLAQLRELPLLGRQTLAELVRLGHASSHPRNDKGPAGSS